MSTTTKLLHTVADQVRSHPEYPALKQDLNRLGVVAVMRAARFIDTDPRVDKLFRDLRRLGKTAVRAGVRLATESLLR
jgi:predicted amidohydrolase YtcJ